MQAQGSRMVAVSFKIPRRLLELLQQAADEGSRTRSRQVLRYVREGLQRDGTAEVAELGATAAELEPDHAARLRLMAQSARGGPPPPWTPREGYTLEHLAQDLEAAALELAGAAAGDAAKRRA